MWEKYFRWSSRKLAWMGQLIEINNSRFKFFNSSNHSHWCPKIEINSKLLAKIVLLQHWPSCLHFGIFETRSKGWACLNWRYTYKIICYFATLRLNVTRDVINFFVFVQSFFDFIGSMLELRSFVSKHANSLSGDESFAKQSKAIISIYEIWDRSLNKLRHIYLEQFCASRHLRIYKWISWLVVIVRRQLHWFIAI